MVRECFNRIIEQARTCQIEVHDHDPYDEDAVEIIRVGFNVVEDGNLSESLPNLYIQDQAMFFIQLKEYVYNMLSKYDMELTEKNITRIIVNLFSNATEAELSDLDGLVSKYLNFMRDNIRFSIETGSINDGVGCFKGETTTQTYHQETPYAFTSCFIAESGSVFPLPRISYGIEGDTCYIYAIQVKDKAGYVDEEHYINVKDNLRAVNSGVKKHRNISPSFVVALSTFLTALSDSGIQKVVVMPKLPLREQNRHLVGEYKIKAYTMGGKVTPEGIENLKKTIDEKLMEISYNSTTKFHNCFSRLRLHFEDLFLSGLDLNNNVLYEVSEMQTSQPFLREVISKTKEVLEKRRFNGKSI